MARKICNFLYASDKAPQKTAIWQRGQYFVIDKTGKKDKYRYAIMFIDNAKNEHLLGYQGNIDLAKRFCNYMYINFPFQDAMNKNWDFSKLAKKYRIKARPTNTVKQTPTAAKPAAAPKPKAAAKPKEEKNPLLDDLKKEAKTAGKTKATRTRFFNKLTRLAKGKIITVADKFEIMGMV